MDLKNLSLYDKVKLCSGDTASEVSQKFFGVPFLRMSDGPHGVRGGKKCYPNLCLLACSWDKDLLFEIGKSLGNDCVAAGVDVLLGPGVNLKRLPVGGRNFEYFSEDPILSGVLAAAMVRGIQQGGTAACVKHFLANNREENRFSYSSEMDDRTLRDLYARVFEITIREGKPKVLMTAYNRFRGIYCAENEYLYNLLRKDLGFGGVVVSDWGGVDYRIKAVRAGMDIDMPGSGKKTNEEVVAAVESGELEEETIDERAAKVVKLLEECRSGKKRVETQITMRQAVADSVVLLKNDGALPLSENADICVIGALAENPVIQGGGCARIDTDDIVSPLSALKKDYPALKFAKGYDLDGSADESHISQAEKAAKQSKVVLFFAGSVNNGDCEGVDGVDMKIPSNQLAALKAVAKVNKSVITVLTGGTPLELGEVIENSNAITECYYAGDAYAEGLCDVLTGRVNPSGRLAETYPLSLEDSPAAKFNACEYIVNYGEGVYTGYRYFTTFNKPTAFPFGYGLSYTRFTYSNFRCDKKIYDGGDDLCAEVTVTNADNRAGKEVVQLFIGRNYSSDAPVCELKAFEKIFLNAGESKTVSLKVKAADLFYTDERTGEYRYPSGAFVISVNSDANTKICEQIVEFNGGDEINRYTRVSDLLKTGKQAAVEKYLTPYMVKTFYGDANRPVVFENGKVKGNDYESKIMGSMQLRVFVSLSGGMLSSEELDELIELLKRA